MIIYFLDVHEKRLGFKDQDVDINYRLTDIIASLTYLRVLEVWKTCTFIIFAENSPV